MQPAPPHPKPSAVRLRATLALSPSLASARLPAALLPSPKTPSPPFFKGKSFIPKKTKFEKSLNWFGLGPPRREPRPPPPPKPQTPGSEEYPPDCRSYDEFFANCTAGKDASMTTCGIEQHEGDAEAIPEMARCAFFSLGARFPLL
jgi:hypothetical protein